MVGDDAVVMRILIQDDGRLLPPGSDATASGSGGGGHFTPSTSVHPQSQVGQRPGVTGGGGASQTTGFAGPSAGAGVREQFAGGTGNPWADVAARRAGVDPQLINLVRSQFAKDPPAAVRSADGVTVNESSGPRVNRPASGGRVPGASPGDYAAGAGVGPEPLPTVTAAGEGWFARATGYLRGLGAAGAAGVAAAGVAAVSLLNSQVRDIGERSRASTARFAGSASSLARNDIVGAAGQYAEGTAEVLEIIPLVGTALGQVVRGANAVVQAFDSTARAFVARGRELAQYSPEAAMAAGRQTVRDVQSDIREANYLGSSYANVSDQYGELMQLLRELLLPIKKFLLGTLATVLGVVNDVLGILAPFIELGMALYQFVFEMLKAAQVFKPLEILGDMLHYLRVLADWARKLAGTKDQDDDILNKFFADAESQFAKGDGRRPAAGFDKAGLGLGAFGRL